MSEIPDDIREKAEEVRDLMWIHSNPRFALDVIAEALMQERHKQRDRAVKMLVGIADVLAGHMVNQATPELLKALADAVKSADGPDQTP